MEKISKYKSDNIEAKRLYEEETDFRDPYFRDVDKILYSLSYLRYTDKTQAFTFESNVHVIKRSVHVQYVSKIARTIGRELGLNEDLIEAGALAHDLGHTPFGHVGESILNSISLEKTGRYFKHNVHSVRVLNSVENYGNGLNLNYQVLDAVLCHNGEIVECNYKPQKKDIDQFIEEYNECYINDDIKLRPSTLEGCVVRISDIIAYIGKDIEDAIRVGVLKQEDFPSEIKNVLGDTNKEIINTIIKDIIDNSRDKNFISLSNEVFNALMDLKKFNYKKIYDYSYSSINKKQLEKEFDFLFDYYLKSIEINDENSSIVKSYLSKMCDKYKENKNEIIVIDYIAGMTDTYFKDEVEKIVKIQKFVNNKKEVENGKKRI